jgi:hypothetical protein
MRMTRGAMPFWRRALPWLLAWFGAQVALVVAGRLLARRLDQGDERSPMIRRVLIAGGIKLRPTDPALSRIEFDLVMAGADLDLTGMGEPAGPVELTVRALMGGVAVRVPSDWRVWWSYVGVGGVGSDGGLVRASDPHGADLRIRARVLFGGVGIESAGPS